jgi:hypothetical protein
MGESAIKSHIKSEKHKQFTTVRECNQDITSFFSLSSSTILNKDDNINNLTIPHPPSEATTAKSFPHTPVSCYFQKEQVIKAEILWTLKLITTHQ